MGPPEKEAPGTTPDTGPIRKSAEATTKQPNLTAQPRQCAFDTVAGLHRRRAASRRTPRLDCGCPDPWPCRCSEPPLSEKMIDAGRDAALHLLDSGNVPVLKFETLQALWRRGGADHVLAQKVWDETGGLFA
jgi:hypothetical protein